jgi:ubiquinone/menaquinone biosynthesis C-methylase UbiE
MKYGTREWFTDKFTTEGWASPTSYFGHRASGYQRYRHRCLVNYLKTLSSEKDSGNMLDIGCGMGDFTMLAHKQCGFDKTIGIDFVEPMVREAARCYPEIEFRHEGLPNLSFPDAYFDVVVALEVLYCLDKKQQLESLQEIWRLLKDGGLFFFSSALGDSYFSDQGARAFVEQRFTIQAVWYEYNRPYHFFTTPLGRINRLAHYVRSNTKPTTDKYHSIFRLFHRPVIGQIARGGVSLVGKATDPLLRSTRVPQLLGSLSKHLSNQSGKTNITILAKKLP